ncbi:hypothetical protein [Lampropedia cohaerens]|nr:hypothetical protein [Lampropedia cohaerens]
MRGRLPTAFVTALVSLASFAMGLLRVAEVMRRYGDTDKKVPGKVPLRAMVLTRQECDATTPPMARDWSPGRYLVSGVGQKPRGRTCAPV